MKSVRYIIGGLLIPIGFYLGFVGISSINVPENMNGPMNISLTPFIQIFVLGMSMPLLYYGTVLVRIPSGWIYLLLAFISIGWVVHNLWFYPVDGGAYYLLRYGRSSGMDSLAPPDPWQHVVAFTCVILFFYWGLTGTFRQAFSSEPTVSAS